MRIGSEKREASREELAALLDEARPLRYENVAVAGATIDDIDEAHVWSFLRWFEGDAFQEANVSGYPTRDVLERDLLLAVDAGIDKVPTVAGLLLFGYDNSVAELLPRSAVSATRFAGDSIQAPVVERVKLVGNLLTLYEGTLGFLRRYCDLWDARPRNMSMPEATDSPVPARANYHRNAISEAVTNMLVHRDLALRDLPTRVHIFDRSIELINPRRSSGFSPIAQRAIRYGITQRINPQLSAMFTNPGYGLDLPRGGLPMLLRESRLFANRRSEIVTFNDEFRLRVYGA
jgi:predicted HTH transcriptional regulator